ncbi:uncharacterized protein LOC131182901 [Hevea brasiliensis]|uniref:uncharacterized protein LOC131182901 n=1 Tax=Hevea brasiliensis TaxID=3981 RepID=UPI0026000A65|nr:uncharacterized protein LOC131182901 [Hevea brasiliensis]
MNLKKHCKAITLRSGRTLQEPEENQKQKEKTRGNHDIQEEEEEKQVEESKEEGGKQEKETMPSYTKFLKEILSKKKRLEDYETVSLIEECSVILQNKLPPKLKDPRSFSIPCLIGNMNIDKDFCDLRASVSLMPLSIYQKLNMGELRPTTISLQLADRFVKYPIGILENIPIKMGKFLFQ